jgi:hypothetical protein
LLSFRSKIKFKPELGCLLHIVNRIFDIPDTSSPQETFTKNAQDLQALLNSPPTESALMDGHLGYDGLRDRLQTAAWIGDNEDGHFMAWAFEGAELNYWEVGIPHFPLTNPCTVAPCRWTR